MPLTQQHQGKDRRKQYLQPTIAALGKTDHKPKEGDDDGDVEDVLISGWHDDNYPT